MKKVTVLALAVIMMISFTACGSTVGDITLDAGQSAIYIQEDGIVSYALSEVFDKDYFDEDDLEDKIKAEVSDYNSSNAASVDNALEINKFKVKGDVATLVLDFMTAYDFLTYSKNYNRVSEENFYIGLISDNTECEIKGDFVSPDQKNTVGEDEIEALGDANILIVSDRYKVQIDGTVQYISTNCSVDEDGIITTAGADDGKSYIVYNNK